MVRTNIYILAVPARRAGRKAALQGGFAATRGFALLRHMDEGTRTWARTYHD